MPPVCPVARQAECDCEELAGGTDDSISAGPRQQARRPPPGGCRLTVRTASLHTPSCAKIAALGGLETHTPGRPVARQAEDNEAARRSLESSAAERRISRPAAPPRRRTLTARTASRHTPLCGTMAALGGLQTHAPWQLVAQQVEGRWRARPSWLAAVAVHARRCRGQPAPSLARPRWMVAERCAAWPASPNSCISEVGCHSFLRPRTILPCGVSC